MRGSLALVLLVATGCGSDATGTTPSASGVFPTSGFTGRNVRVEVSGDATNFAAGATLDFGAGVTVSNVTVASPTDLFADVAIDAGAALGDVDVVVKNGSDTYTLSKAFELVSPVKLLTGGQFAQGSVAQVEIKNLDLENPFDSTCDLNTPFGCFHYANMDITIAGGVTVQVSSVDDTHAFGTAFIDTDATGGAVTVASGLGATLLTSKPADSAPVMARTAVAAPAAAGNLTVASGGTALVSFSASGAGVAQIIFDPADPASGAQLYILPASGHFADKIKTVQPDQNTGVLTGDVVTKAAGSYYAIYADDGAGDTITNQQKLIPFSSTIADTEPNNASAQAQALTLVAGSAVLFDAASLSSITDADWMKFTAGAGDAGKTIRVVTGGDDLQTDTVVDAYAANGTTSLGTSADSDYAEDFTSSPIAIGLNYVKISASTVFNASHKNYIAAIWLE